MLTGEQLEFYHQNGYLVLRNLVPAEELKRLTKAVFDTVERGDYFPPGMHYPEHGKYTVSENRLADPNLAYIAEHPAILEAAEAALGHAPRLTAYVAYLRTPDDIGAGKHNDYKRWRPVGSSMNWLFTILPLIDFDQQTGPLLVSPGSHKLHHVMPTVGRVLDVTRPDADKLQPFVDAEINTGDLLLMNMYTWHRAPANPVNRYGMFNKYCAANAPPATGYFLYNEDVHAALSEEGRRILAVHSDRELASTRLVIEREGDSGPELCLVRQAGRTDTWTLPGGAGFEDDAIPGWDVGARIGSCEAAVTDLLGLEVPWMSYIGDYEENGHLCRTYGYSLPAHDTLAPAEGIETQWLTQNRLQELAESGQCGGSFEPDAFALWQDESIIRGKGKSQARAKDNQFA